MVRYDHKKILVDYFKKNLAKGYTPESLKWALVNQGYLKLEISQALEQANKELAEKAPLVKEKPRIKYELYDEYDTPIKMRFSFWKKFKSFFQVG